MDIRNAMEQHLNYCENQLKFTAKSLEAYQGDYLQLEQFLLAMGVSKIEEVTRKHFREFVDFLKEKYAPRTAKRRIASTKSLFAYLHENEYIDICPTEGVRTKIKLGDDTKVVLEVAELNRILYMAYNDSSKKNLMFHYRDISVLEILFITGLRNQELGQMKYENWDDVEECFVFKGKGQKTRRVYIENREVIGVFQRYVKLAKPKNSEYIFLNKFNKPLSTSAVADIVARYSRMAGINKKVTPHAFRRTLATMLIEEGMDISYVQRILGHSSITTTQEYIRLSERAIQRENANKNPRNKMSFKDYSEFKIS